MTLLSHPVLETAGRLLRVEDPLGQSIVITIGALTALGLMLAIVPLARALLASSQIAKLGRTNRTLQAEELFATCRKGLLGTRIVLLEVSRRSGIPVNLEALSAISKAQLSGGALPKGLHLLSEILTPLGLVGTFVGLALALQQVGILLSTVPRDRQIQDVLASLTASLSQIDATMTGLSVAVATSIAGIVGTILLTAAGRLVEAANERALLRLEQLTVARLLPAFSSDAQTALNRMLSTLEKRTGGLAASINAFNQTLEQGTEVLRKRIGAIVTATQKQGQRLGAVITSLQNTIEASATSFEERIDASSTSFKTSVEAAANDVRSAADHVATKLDGAGESISNASTSFDRSVTTTANGFANHVKRAGTGFRKSTEAGATSFATNLQASFEAADSRLAEIIEATDQSARQHGQAIDRYAELTGLSCDANDELRDAVLELTGAVSANDRKLVELAIDGRSFVDVMAEMAQVLVAREQNLQAAEILFNDWIVKVSTSLDTLATDVRNEASANIQQARQELTETTRSVKSLLAEQRADAGRLESAHKDLQTTAVQLRTLAEGQTSGNKELRSAGRDLGDVGERVRAAVVQLGNVRHELEERRRAEEEAHKRSFTQRTWRFWNTLVGAVRR